MATDKKFTVCGTSTLEGEMKVRFANDVMRVKVLDKHGHTDITLVQLDTPLSKMEAAEFIMQLPEFASDYQQAAIADYIERNTPKEPKPAKVVVAPVAKKAVPAKSPAKPAVKLTVEEAALEDEPY
jgi:hypothetical protein